VIVISPAVTGALLGGAGFLGFVSTQWLILHWLSPASRARVLAVAFAAWFVGIAVMTWVLGDAMTGRLSGVIVAVMTMSCLFVLYAPFYYVLSNSLSLQSMIVLLESKGSLGREALYGRFASTALVEGRLSTMERSGYVTRDAARFRITERGRRLIAPFLLLKSLWRMGPGG